jgi:hypothetical protein
MKHDDLHDATFLGAEVRWAEGVAVLKFRVHPNREVWLRARDFSSVSIPRKSEWGPSESVNHIRWSSDVGPVDVELQSGDTIHVAAAAFAIESPE